MWLCLLFDLLSYNDASGTNDHVCNNIEWCGNMSVFGTYNSFHKLKIISIGCIVEQQLSMSKKLTTIYIIFNNILYNKYIN